MELRVDIVATHFIKPSSPNPNDPNLYQLSLIDQLTPPDYIPLVLYYPAAVSRSSITQRLKKSLSTTLNHFYPLVGRINASDVLIDYSRTSTVSHGVPYKEANVAADLREVVAKRDLNMVWPLLPSKGLFDEDAKIIPLRIQASFFQCGGMTIGICASHLVIDGVAFGEFPCSWAVEQGGRAPPPPDLAIVRSLLPPSNLVKSQGPDIISDDDDDVGNIVSKSFVFSGASISALKLGIGKSNKYYRNQPPTRGQAVVALLWTCMMKAISVSSTNCLSILTTFVNMRTRVDPSLPQNSFGNFYGCLNMRNGEDITNMNLPELTDLQNLGLKDFCKRVKVNNKEDLPSVVLNMFEEQFEIFTRQDVDIFTVSS